MRSRALSQADLARALGVADAQVSRWRRGQVVPSPRHLQRLADALAVPRADLDRLAGYPVPGATPAEGGPVDPAAEAELQAHQARFRRTLEQAVPRDLWPAYAAACEALAAGLVGSFAAALDAAAEAPERTVTTYDPAASEPVGGATGIGFRTRPRGDDGPGT